MTDRLNLTAEQAREFNETGRVELWTELEPQPENTVMISHPDEVVSFHRKNDMKWIETKLPFGPNGERWVAEPWTNRYAGSTRYLADYDYPSTHAFKWYYAKDMPENESRANANIATTVEQRDGVWGFVTVVERKVENA